MTTEQRKEINVLAKSLEDKGKSFGEIQSILKKKMDSFSSPLKHGDQPGHPPMVIQNYVEAHEAFHNQFKADIVDEHGGEWLQNGYTREKNKEKVYGTVDGVPYYDQKSYEKAYQGSQDQFNAIVPPSIRNYDPYTKTTKKEKDPWQFNISQHYNEKGELVTKKIKTPSEDLNSSINSLVNSTSPKGRKENEDKDSEWKKIQKQNEKNLNKNQKKASQNLISRGINPDKFEVYGGDFWMVEKDSKGKVLRRIERVDPTSSLHSDLASYNSGFTHSSIFKNVMRDANRLQPNQGQINEIEERASNWIDEYHEYEDAMKNPANQRLLEHVPMDVDATYVTPVIPPGWKPGDDPIMPEETEYDKLKSLQSRAGRHYRQKNNEGYYIGEAHKGNDWIDDHYKRAVKEIKEKYPIAAASDDFNYNYRDEIKELAISYIIQGESNAIIERNSISQKGVKYGEWFEDGFNKEIIDDFIKDLDAGKSPETIKHQLNLEPGSKAEEYLNINLAYKEQEAHLKDIKFRSEKLSADLSNTVSGLESLVNGDEHDRIKALREESEGILQDYKDGKFTTKEQIESARAIIERNNSEITKAGENYKTLSRTYKSLAKSVDLLRNESSLAQDNILDFHTFKDIIGKDHGILSGSADLLGAATLNMITGVEEWTHSLLGVGVFDLVEIIPGTDINADALRKDLNNAAAEIREGVGRKTWDEAQSWTDYIHYSTNTLFEAAPQIATIMLTKRPVGMSLMYANVAGQDYIRNKDAFHNGEISWSQYHSSANLKGAWELVTEIPTFGYASALKQSLKQASRTGLRQTFVNSFAQQIKPKALFNGSKTVFGEGLSEYGAGLGHQYVDKFILKDDSVVIGEGLDEDFRTGALVGFAYFRLPQVGVNLLRSHQSRRSTEQRDANIDRIEELTKMLSNPNLENNLRQSYKQEIENLTAVNFNILKKDIERIDYYSKEEKEKLTEIEVAKSNIRNKVKSIKLDKTISKANKSKEIDKLLNEFSELDGKKEELISKYDFNLKQKVEEEANFQSVKKGSKEIFGDNMEVISTSSRIEQAELLERNLHERKIALISKFEMQNTPLTEQAAAEIKSINNELQKVRNLKEDPNQESIVGGALGAYGYITPKDANGTQQLIINRKAPIEDGFVTTAQHEFLHGVLHETLKNDEAVQESVGEALQDYLGDITTGSLAETQLASRMMQYMDAGTGVFNEEAMVLLSEAMVKENLPFKESMFQPVQDTLRRIFQNYLGKDIEFNTGKDVFNFIKDYNHSVKTGKWDNAIRRMARQGAKGKLIPDSISKAGRIKLSKQASDNVQNIYNEKGEAGIQDILNEYKPMVGKIVQKYRDVPGFDAELLASEIELGHRGIYDLVRDYKPETEVPLAAYINKFLPSRAIDAAKRVLKTEFEADVTEVRGLTVEETSVEDVEVPKKKIKLADRLGKDAVKINREVKKSIPDLKDLNFKNLKDLTPNLTQEMFGIVPKPGNLTKKDILNAQMFINKNANTLLAMLPEGATSGGTSTGVQKVLLDAFYVKTDRASMAKTGTKAGLAIQVKRDNINIPEFLEVFGITERGQPNLYKKDSNTSARIKALVAQTGKMLTNQAVREEITKRGNVSDNVRLSLEDGKSVYMFSRSGIDSKYPEFVQEVLMSNYNDKKSVANAVDRIYKDDLTKKQMGSLVNKVYDQIKDYNKILKKHSNPEGKSIELPKTIEEFLLDEWIGENTDYAIKEALINVLPLDKNGRVINIGTHFFNKDRVIKQRSIPVDLGLEFVKDMGVPGAAQYLLKYFKGMYAGASGIADKRYIFRDGELIDNPNFDPNTKSTNRKQVFESVPDFVENVIGKIGVDVYNKDGSVKSINQLEKELNINTTLLTESSDAALRDMNFEGREVQALETREAIEKLMDFAWKKVSSKNPSLDYADLGMLITSMGSGMSSIMRRGANFKYLGESVLEVPRAERGKKLEYEHMIPQVQMALRVLKSYMNNGKLDPSVWEDYHVAVIRKTMDKVLVENKLRSKRPEGQHPYYNMSTFGDKRMESIRSIDPKDKGTDREFIGRDFVKASNIMNGTNKDMQDLGALRRAYKMSRIVNKPNKGMSVWDLDDTLARTKSGVRYTMPNPDGSPQPGRKVIFLAGGAGSGKSNVVNKLGLEKQGFKIVNQDIALEWLKKNHGLPEDMRDLTQKQASQLGKLTWEARRIATRKLMKYKGRGDGIVVDGTGGSLKNMQKQVDEFRAKGYDVQMLFVETSLETALERNRNRKERSLRDSIVKANHEKVQSNKESFKELFGNNFAEVKTDKLTMDSPMPLKLIEQMDGFTRGYIKGRLDAGEFAHKGADLETKNATFDFSEFNQIIEGEQGPLFGKAIDRAKKYGLKDQYILTARPHAAKIPIYEFLKAQGLNIPLENIITLESSTSESKALWIADMVGEGYNDIYFADDHLANVQAVKNMLDQFDVKSKVQQAKYKFSKDMNFRFNQILEETKGIRSETRFSDVVAQKRGEHIGKWKFFIPPSAEDFKGLIYNFLTKGKRGDEQMKFFQKALIDPFGRAIREINSAKQTITHDYRKLKKEFPNVRKKLGKPIPNTSFTYDHAIRAYLWNDLGMEIPGLSGRDTKTLIETVANDPELKAFSQVLGKISKQDQGYVQPSDHWVVESIASDLDNITNKVGRKDYLAEWIENKNIIFSKENLNKIEAVYGSNFREALEDILYRMENGTNRQQGQSRLTNMFSNWVNNSVGAIMFFNARSATLQLLSTVNFINWSDNNIFKASAAFANQPQYWKDFAMIFNSDMLKQRRAGLKTDVNESEIANAVANSKNKAKAALAWLLKKGFLPTQIADSFAIASGGATFYRNRVNKYLKEGMPQQQAESKAFEDFQQIAEETQQSSRPDLISQQQASPLGRLILAFQNTPMQYARLMKKAATDLVKGRGDWKTNVSRIIYYGAIQNFIFAGLQAALFALIGSDDEELIDKKSLRVGNTMLDSLLRGFGIGGAAVSTVKNMILKFHEQEQKDWGADHAYTLIEAVNLSPPIGSKLRKLYSAIQSYKFNKDIIPKMSLDINNPIYEIIGNVVSATTNVPLDRMVNKTNNVKAAVEQDMAAWQRVALMMGWNRWDIGIEDVEKTQAKQEVREEKKQKKKIEDKIKKQVKREEEEQKIQTAIEEEVKQQEKDIKEGKTPKEPTCAASTSSGARCKNKVAKIGDRCTVHEKVEQRADGKKVRCKKIKSDGERCGMKTTNKSGFCFYHD